MSEINPNYSPSEPQHDATTTTTTTATTPTDPKQWTLYLNRPSSIPPAFSTLLTEYSSIPTASQLSHIIKVRDRAYSTVPYPCLGRFRFLNLDLSSHPLYKTHILPTLTSPSHPAQFLDIGSCLGQDLRKLVFDGVPVSRVHGADMRWELIDPGYELFQDEAKFPRDRFLVPGNLLDYSDASALKVMDARCDIVNLLAVFHLFDRPDQVVCASRALGFLKRGEGARKLVVGQNLAKERAEVELRNGKRRFRHDEESWRELWEEVFGGETWKGIVKAWEVAGVMTDPSPGVTTGYLWHLWWTWVEFV